MSWHFSRALVVEYLGGNSSGGEPFAPSNGTPTHGMFWSPDKTTDASKPSRSGMTFRPSTERLGADLLTWCLAASRARTSAPRARALESKASEAVCGSTWRESSVRFCRDSSSWKTHLCLWEEDLDWSSVTWPKWGMMRNGVLWERITPPPLTSGIESGSWPTVRSTDGERGGRGDLIQAIRGNENSHYKLWPTPNQRDWKDTGATQGNRKSPNLGTMVHQWATPTKADAQGGPGRSDKRTGGDNLRTQAGGQLNPTWVEWLMGWPLGWTDCAASATAKFREWCRSHGSIWKADEESDESPERPA